MIEYKAKFGNWKGEPKNNHFKSVAF